MSQIKENLERINLQIADACKEASRDISEITLLPVTKRQPLEKLQTLYELGKRSFGENKVQELNDKAPKLSADIQWHLIGQLQSNKVRVALKYACCIHSVDSIKLLNRLDRIAGEESKNPEIFLQVNLTGEPQKGGFEPEQIKEAISKASNCENIKLKGLMTMAAAGASPSETRDVFKNLRLMRDSFMADFPQLTELSMGMSGDFELAILEGATYIRIGSLLLGERQY